MSVEFFRFKIAKARMQASGIDWQSIPLVGLQLIGFLPLESWLGKKLKAEQEAGDGGQGGTSPIAERQV